MAVFAPNFNEKNVDDVFVYGFWTYNNQQRALVPLGMTFENRADLGGEVVGFPNPVIERMSKQEYLILKLNYEFNLVDQVWNNIRKENPVIDPETGKTVWEYYLDLDLVGAILVPSDLTERYDLIGDETSLKNITVFIYGLLFGKGGFELASGPYRLESIPAIEVNFDANNLLKTYCRYKSIDILSFGGNEEDVGTFFDCGTLLPFEQNFLTPFFLLGQVFPLLLNTFSRKKLIINNKEIVKDEPLPNCNRCFRWKVFCGDCDSIQVLPNFKGLIISPVDEIEQENGNLEDTSIRYFISLEGAQNWVQRTIERLGTKWTCCIIPKLDPVSGEFFKDENDNIIMENKCYEISAYCEDSFGQTYNSKEECEEDCGKEWYCINDVCVRRHPDDPETEGAPRYDTELECIIDCAFITETPTEEPTEFPTETPS
jgi:hypothetical protein